MEAMNATDKRTMKTHWKELPKGKVNAFHPTHVQAMMTGCALLTQNSQGQIRITWQNHVQELVPMSDMNLAEEANFPEAFRKVWMRKETGA